MVDPDSDSLPAAMEGSTSCSSPQVAIPSRITGIGEGEIQRLIRDLEGLCSSIGELKQGLELLRSPLMALSESEDPTITAKCWTKQVRKLCYDTGDYLYDFLHSGNEFKLLGARALDASRRLEWCGIQPQTTSTSTARHLPAAPRADLIDLGHMVDEVNNLIGNQKELKVVSIVGPEGVGKTTLAKRLYQSVGGNGTFHFRAFLRASPKPDIRRLLTSMFMQIQRKWPSCRLNAYELVDSIARYLQNKRYFIIIDDLWTAAVWEIISRAFPDGDCGSRIITTTQTKGVALACCGYQSKYVFMMEPLTDAQSENLFFRTVYGSESGCPWHLEEVSHEIIRKCGGLPLATINIASMLPSGLNSEELKSVRDTLPYTLRTNPTPEWMKELVNLLYSTLRPHLKTCLLYFSMYSEGYIVRKDDLVKQWVVEGFLDGVQGQATEEIARGYFDELVRRGMIQPVDIKNGEVLSCTLHHMIHDVIVNKSMEENFVIIANYFQSAIPLPDKVRRLSVQFRVAKSAHIPESIIVSELRSLAFCGFFECLRSIAKYRHLRVLILDIWADEDEDAFDLTGIRELLRLRYLKIACNITVKLPDEIQGQQYLETLEVDATVVAIPWDIGGLTRLSSIKIAVRELLSKDICFLQILPALTALSVHVKTPPTETIVLDEGGFLNLKFFTFRCSAPHLLIEEKSMPKIEKLNLCFNAREARQDGKKPIIIEHLATLKEISVKIGGAAADADSALANAVTNDPNNPRVQLMQSREDEEHGTLEEQDEIMEKDAHEYFVTQDVGSGGREIVEEDRDDTYGIQDDGSGKDEHKEADSREGLDDTYGIQDDGSRKDEHKEADSRRRNNMTGELLEGIKIYYEDELGSGGYANVYKGRYNSKDIAVKTLQGTVPVYKQHFENERKILQSLEPHQNIVKLLGQCKESKTGSMALCFEYINKGSLDKHLDDQNSLYDWCTWYAIILGICNGLKHLQESNPPILHLDIKPANILVDENMVPKLADFGEAWALEDNKTQNTGHKRGTEPYRPPEYNDESKISKTYDIYSLGVVMMKILDGSKANPEANNTDPVTFTKRVREKWRKRTDPATLHNEQVKQCIKIALKCVKNNRSFRPTIEDIINNLNAISQIKDPIPGSCFDQDLLEVYPLQLHFPFKEDKVIACALLLTNKTDRHAAFKCIADNPKCYLNRLSHLNGILPPSSTCTYVVAMEKHKRLPNMDEYSVFLKSRVAEKDTDADKHISDQDTVRGVPMLKAVHESEPIRPRIEIITVCGRDYRIVSMDVHPTEPWILASHVNGNISIWNHQTQERVIELRLSNERDYDQGPRHCIRSAKFIARAKWFVAGDGNGFIHVVTYTTMREVKKFKAHEYEVMSLAVHPGEKPFVLSASYGEQIKLWKWDADWKCIRTFKEQSQVVVDVMFNRDGNTFASASLSGKVEIWSTDPNNRPKPIAILDCGEDRQQRVAYFYKDDRQYMISGSLGGAARVWDLQTNKCIKKLEGSESEIPGCNVGVVNDLLDNPVLITVSGDDGICFLDTTTYESRFNKINFGLGTVKDFAYIEVEGKRSLVIAFTGGIAIMEMNEDVMTPLPSEAAAQSGPEDDPKEGRPRKDRQVA